MRACLAALLALIAAGCGGGHDDTDRVRAMLGEYARAVAHHDAHALCVRILDPDLVAAVERASAQPCVTAVRSLFAGPAPRLDGGRVRIDGDVATAAAGRETYTFVRTRAGWRVTSLGNDGGPPGP